MSTPSSRFANLLQATRFLSSCVELYGLADGRLDATAADTSFMAFFSRTYIRERRWAIFPLWEGDITTLMLSGGKKLPLLELIRGFSLNTGGRYLHAAAIANTQYLTYQDATAMIISDATLDLVDQDPAILFQTTATHVPHWGDNFLWPSNERFAIYTNGDQAAFIAGERQELLDLLGVSYDYCVERTIAAHAKLRNAPERIAPFIAFCHEFTQ